ncbi:hypothetical protein EJV47_09700 [Hymenobacter gummosus]|uniref:LVIVD repeat-containing protein n=1 Tax=Hymenobacter gummosus TaxID=1776032 RepID=A0A3S0H7V7_9BACT|nr:hypothetical protein [Hymenobacter gummosus]RTQ50878.1 hypothetical protein EJV47_09700 [Hymenobacter gummosus]
MKPFSSLLRFGRAHACWLLLLGGCADASVAPSTANVGLAGSMSRFAILGNTLYTVDSRSLRVFDLGSVSNTSQAPRLLRTTTLGVDIETIYPSGSYLFIGTQSGMYIFDAADPQQPRQVGFYQHAVSCDPVVVDGRWAYLTLRTGRSCGGGPNQLQVIDLQNLNQPRLAQSYPMTQPYGLGVDAGLLFVCDDGLKVFDTSQSPALTQRDQFAIDAYDVIPSNGHLLVIGRQGLYQYQYAGRALQQLSFLPITPRP